MKISTVSGLLYWLSPPTNKCHRQITWWSLSNRRRSMEWTLPNEGNKALDSSHATDHIRDDILSHLRILIGSLEHISVKSWSKKSYFNWWKLIWISRLQDGGHLSRRQCVKLAAPWCFCAVGNIEEKAHALKTGLYISPDSIYFHLGGQWICQTNDSQIVT